MGPLQEGRDHLVLGLHRGGDDRFHDGGIALRHRQQLAELGVERLLTGERRDGVEQ